MQFGWRGSPEWFGFVASAIEDEHRRTAKNSVKFTPAGVRTTAHVQIAPPSGNRTERVPAQCRTQEVEGVGTEDTAWTRFFVDDAISMDVQHDVDGGRCLALATGLASSHHEMLGEREEGEAKVLAKKMMIGTRFRLCWGGW